MSSIKTAALNGLEAQLVSIACAIKSPSPDSLPSFDVLGIPDLAQREARVRIRSSIRHSGFPFPATVVSAKLEPLTVRKNGTHYDLAIALSILAEQGVFAHDMLDGWLVIGELSLDGTVRPVTGVVAMAELAKNLGYKGVMVPHGNAKEAELVQGIQVQSATNLKDVVANLKERKPCIYAPDIYGTPGHAIRHKMDWSDIAGHEAAKRALEIAVAGGHNVLMVGIPGTGKTMLGRRLPTIMPELPDAEYLEVTKVVSVAGLLPRDAVLSKERPFRAPHHTCSGSALVGGGSVAMPGEVSLAHRGVLFMDEFGEFPRSTLEALAEPITSGESVIVRGGQRTKYPAKPLLVGASNPCFCGYLGSQEKTCVCNLDKVTRYQARLRTGPIAKCFDIQIQLKIDLSKAVSKDTSEIVRARTVAARAIQAARYGKNELNGTVPFDVLQKSSPLDSTVVFVLDKARDRLGFGRISSEAAMRLARTIADMAGETDITVDHMREAIELRWSEAMSVVAELASVE